MRHPRLKPWPRPQNESPRPRRPDRAARTSMRNTPPPPRRIRAAHESKSAAVRAAAAAPSRRQQYKWQREQSQQRTLYIAVGILLTVVLAIFAVGVVYDNVIRANEVVAQIGTDNITAAQL